MILLCYNVLLLFSERVAWLGREVAFSVLVGIKKLRSTCHRQAHFTYSGIVHQLTILAIIAMQLGPNLAPSLAPRAFLPVKAYFRPNRPFGAPLWYIYKAPEWANMTHNHVSYPCEVLRVVWTLLGHHMARESNHIRGG